MWRETERLGVAGSMGAVVGVRRELVEAVCEELRGRGLAVWIGNVNSNTQFVLTGTEAGVRRALLITEVNDEPVTRSAIAPFLAEAGFVPTAMGYQMRASSGQRLASGSRR